MDWYKLFKTGRKNSRYIAGSIREQKFKGIWIGNFYNNYRFYPDDDLVLLFESLNNFTKTTEIYDDQF